MDDLFNNPSHSNKACQKKGGVIDLLERLVTDFPLDLFRGQRRFRLWRGWQRRRRLRFCVPEIKIVHGVVLTDGAVRLFVPVVPGVQLSSAVHLVLEHLAYPAHLIRFQCRRVHHDHHYVPGGVREADQLVLPGVEHLVYALGVFESLDNAHTRRGSRQRCT